MMVMDAEEERALIQQIQLVSTLETDAAPKRDDEREARDDCSRRVDTLAARSGCRSNALRTRLQRLAGWQTPVAQCIRSACD